MASKVNTKFILGLGAALSLAFVVVAYIAYQAIKKSGDDYILLGDKAMAEQKYTEATTLYGKAVFKDQRNVAWLSKWLSAIEKDTPKGRALYTEAYGGKYRQAIQALAEADRTSYELNRRAINEPWEVVRVAPSLRGLEGFVQHVEANMKAFQGDPEKAKLLWRYRGLAKVAMLGFNPDLKQVDLDIARRDLEASLAVDPADKDAFLALVNIDLAAANRARRRDDKVTANQITEAVQARLAKFIADYPPGSAAMAAQIRIELNTASQASDRIVSVQDILQDPSRQAHIEALIAAILAEPPEKIEPDVVLDAARWARAALPHPRSVDAPKQLFDFALNAKPDNPLLLRLASTFASDRGDNEAALALLQKIVDMPDRPMSLEGLMLFDMRPRAVKLQTDIAFRDWESQKELDKKAAAAALAKKLRDDFVARVGETSNEVLAIDARLAFINGDVKGATTLLARYNQVSKEQDPDAMALQGSLMLQQGNIGAAKQSFERVVQLDPTNIRALIALSRLATDANNYSEALRYTTAARALQPDNAALKEQEKILGDLAGGRVQDPVLQVIVKAQQERSGIDADPAKSLATLREGMKQGKNAEDFRLHAALIQQLMRMQDTAGALTAIDEALARFPDSEMSGNLRRLKENLQTGDPITAALERVGSANAPEVAKEIARYTLLCEAKRLDEAKTHLDAAVKLAPDDPQVFDAQFDYGLRTENKDELRRLVDIAEKKNYDQVGGQFYRARLLVVESKFEEAVVALRNVVERDRLNFPAWRLLGITQMRLGNADGAADAFSKAVAIRPQDVPSITGYIRALAGARRIPEALDFARKSEKLAASDEEFTELYLQLLTHAPGGDPQKARELRERLATLRPQNKGNKIDLVLLQIDQRRWDEAKATIDSLRNDEALKDHVVGLEARWYSLQGKYAEAEKVFEDAIAAIPANELTENPFIAAAEVFSAVGQPDRAVRMLEKGRPHQKKETMLIDRSLGDVLYTARRYPEAVAAYKRVLDAGSPDTDDAVAKRILEAALFEKNFARFDEMMASLGDRAKKDATLLLLSAEAASMQGDTAGASRLYDQAVAAADSRNFIVFMKRGDFSARDPDKIRDAIADYEEAARRNPTSTAPQRKLFVVYAETGKPEKAIEQLTKAVAIDPHDDALRSELINIHLSRNEQAEVVDLVDQAIKLKPDSIQWQLEGASIMSRLDRFDRAADYAKLAWEKEKTLRSAIPYVTALLNKKPQPDLATARQIVTDKELEKADEVPRRILRALFYNKAQDPDRANSEMGQALAKLDQANPQQVDLFLAGLESVYGGPAEQLAALNRIKGQTRITGWLEIQLEVFKLRDPATAAAAASQLNALADASKEPQVKASVYQLLAGYYMQVNQPDKSVAFSDKQLAVNPDDVGALNNSAYLMATRLNQPADALPRAERAAELAPDSPTILDTLGAVHLRLKNHQKAVEALEKAVARATADSDLVPALLHLAAAYHGVNKPAEAQKMLVRARDRIKAVPALEPQFAADLKEVSALIDGQ